MNLLLIVLLTALFLALLLFAVALKIIFTFNSGDANLNLTLLWLYPFLKAVVTNEETVLVLTIYLFNRSIYRRALNAKKRKAAGANRVELIKWVRPRDVNVYTSYGFRDPSITGMACGALGILSQFVKIDSLYQNPCFVTDNDYIYVNATARLNIGSAIISLYRAYIANSGK